MRVSKFGCMTRITDEQLNGPPPLTQEQEERYAAEAEAADLHIRTGLSRAPQELRMIIDLHRDGDGACQSCDDGYEWPCATIQLIADTYDPEGV